MRKSILFSPDSEPGAASTAQPAKRAKAKAVKAAAPKESRAEEIVHELFRLARVDLRASGHGKKLASEFASLMKGGF